MLLLLVEPLKFETDTKTSEMALGSNFMETWPK